jgi:site-specific DNA-cytosine methylase
MPRAFLLENVPGLLTCDEGRALATIMQALAQVGYNVRYQVLNSRVFVPQVRKRLYLVGIRRDLRRADERFRFPFTPDLRRRLRDVLEEDDCVDRPARYTLSPKQWRKVQRRGAAHVTQKRLLRASGCAGTLISHYRRSFASSTTQFVPRPAPHNPRFLTERECCRLQGWPETFQCGNWWSFYKLVGRISFFCVCAFVVVVTRASGGGVGASINPHWNIMLRCARLIDGVCRTDHLTVGKRVDISHRASTHP